MPAEIDLFKQINNAVLDLQGAHLQSYDRPLKTLARIRALAADREFPVIMFPWVKDRSTCVFHIRRIARHQIKLVLKRGRREHCINNRRRMAGIPLDPPREGAP